MIGNLATHFGHQDRNFESTGDLMSALRAAKPVKAAQLAQIPSAAGAYILSERGRAVYVGVSENLRRRLRQETSGKPDQSALAFKLARERVPRKPGELEPSRKELMGEPKFAAAMNAAVERVKNMEGKWVVIGESSQRNVFSLLATLALNAPHNDFNTR
jgi:hypothetical protein